MTTPTLEIVGRLVRETLGRPADFEVRPEQLLFYDLAFTSLDLLDLLFRIEDQFRLLLPEARLLRLTQGALTDDDFAKEGVLTTRGRAQLMGVLYDSPPEIFPESIHTATVSRYCTVGAMVRLVDAAAQEQA